MVSLGRHLRLLGQRSLTTVTAKYFTSTLPPARTASISRTYFSSTHPRPLTTKPTRTFFSPRLHTLPPRPNLIRPRRHPYTTANPNSNSNSSSASPPKQSLSARLKQLSREYGWAALAVYLGLSALDFPFCFLAVRYLGTDTIGVYEKKIVGAVRRAFPKLQSPSSQSEVAVVAVPEVEHAEEAAEDGTPKKASIWAELALAYAIHKSFIFIRVPLTAAVTPKVVRVLRGWGWVIGRKGVKDVEKMVKKQ